MNCESRKIWRKGIFTACAPSQESFLTIQIRPNMRHVLMEVSRVRSRGQIANSRVGNKIPAATGYQHEQRVSLSISVCVRVELRISAGLKGSFERESESRNLQSGLL